MNHKEGICNLGERIDAIDFGKEISNGKSLILEKINRIHRIELKFRS